MSWIFWKKKIEAPKVEDRRGTAQKLHDAYQTISYVEDVIQEVFDKYEPEIADQIEFHIGSDYYDNSIEIYFDNSLPYPYEPCHEIRKAVYDLGFSIVFWNFLADVQDVICDRFIGQESQLVKNSPDEIRGYEPRHNKNAHWEANKYGYVDERFDMEAWEAKYKRAF